MISFTHERYGVSQGRERLTGKERVRKREDLARLMQRGNRHHSRQYTLVIVKNGLELARIATSVRKKIGKAAVRNYEKRLVKECFRREKENFPKGLDLLVVVKQATEDFASSYRELKDLFHRSLL